MVGEIPLLNIRRAHSGIHDLQKREQREDVGIRHLLRGLAREGTAASKRIAKTATWYHVVLHEIGNGWDDVKRRIQTKLEWQQANQTIVKNSVASSQAHLAVAFRVPGETDARGKIVFVRLDRGARDAQVTDKQ